ncbi:hypothetical protein B0H11DRAFT_1942211 [Mycena galericulata]|nr:hypothetical protein B0H11DRAFT_1942211 [Mycena galericulata]
MILYSVERRKISAHPQRREEKTTDDETRRPVRAPGMEPGLLLDPNILPWSRQDGKSRPGAESSVGSNRENKEINDNLINLLYEFGQSLRGNGTTHSSVFATSMNATLRIERIKTKKGGKGAILAIFKTLDSFDFRAEFGPADRRSTIRYFWKSSVGLLNLSVVRVVRRKINSIFGRNKQSFNLRLNLFFVYFHTSPKHFIDRYSVNLPHSEADPAKIKADACHIKAYAVILAGSASLGRAPDQGLIRVSTRHHGPYSRGTSFKYTCNEYFPSEPYYQYTPGPGQYPGYGTPPPPQPPAKPTPEVVPDAEPAPLNSEPAETRKRGRPKGSGTKSKEVVPDPKTSGGRKPRGRPRGSGSKKTSSPRRKRVKTTHADTFAEQEKENLHVNITPQTIDVTSDSEDETTSKRWPVADRDKFFRFLLDLNEEGDKRFEQHKTNPGHVYKVVCRLSSLRSAAVVYVRKARSPRFDFDRTGG